MRHCLRGILTCVSGKRQEFCMIPQGVLKVFQTPPDDYPRQSLYSMHKEEKAYNWPLPVTSGGGIVGGTC